MEEEKKVVEELLVSFIKKMNEWEKLCNKIDSDKSISHDEQMEILAAARGS